MRTCVCSVSSSEDDDLEMVAAAVQVEKSLCSGNDITITFTTTLNVM